MTSAASVTAAGLTIQTSGTDARAVEVTPGGAANLTGGTTRITTAGSTAHGLHATGAGATINAGPLTVATSGAGAHAVFADAGGQIVLAPSTIVSTTGDGAIGLDSNGAGALLVAGAGTRVTTSGMGSHGGFATRTNLARSHRWRGVDHHDGAGRVRAVLHTGRWSDQRRQRDGPDARPRLVRRPGQPRGRSPSRVAPCRPRATMRWACCPPGAGHPSRPPERAS
ncbi:MAG: hypothetical protein WDN45_01320 [Caulobacteraceae bacterium]